MTCFPITARRSVFHLLFLVMITPALVGGKVINKSEETTAPYHPMTVPEISLLPPPLDLMVKTKDSGREVPVRVYLPRTKLAGTRSPVILFSHGLGGSRLNNAYLGRHWSGRGYVCVFMQHPGSDESVWRDVPLLKRLSAMKTAANAENFMLRIADVRAVLDQLTEWDREAGHALFGIMDLTRIGMSGHSFGAATTQAVSGQSLGFGFQPASDARIKAAVMFSPNASERRGSPAESFGSVRIPWMLMTGTHDESRIGGATVATRLAVFPGLPPGDKYELVLDGAEHSAFSEAALMGDKRPRNPNHHRAILALSTAFWDAYLRKDPQAAAWLKGAGVWSVLDAKDRWQLK